MTFCMLTILFLSTYMMSGYLYDGCLPVLCLATCTYDVLQHVRYDALLRV
jgi:hypothetical protein